MDLSVPIFNEEDIEFIRGLPKDKFDKVIQTALSIGFKSIQMSEVNMDCHSYIEPLRKIISQSTGENTEKINEIADQLNALLHIRTNSSRKGRLSENLCIQRLSQQYPDWDFVDVAHVGHEGDCRAISPIGEILYEFKSYDTNVNKEQLNKFYKDLETTGIKLGIFVSNTSGIVGKKDLEWEIIGGSTLVIYISNVGFNGQGCIMATELLLALMKSNILDTENHWLLYQNYETDEIYRNLVDTLDDYRKDNEMICKLQKSIKDFRSKNNVMIDGLDSEIFQLSLNTQNTFSKMLGLVEQIKSGQQIVTNFNLDDFILANSFVDKIKTQFTKISDLVKENEIVKKVAGQVGVDPVALVGGGTVFVVLFTYFIFGVGLLCNLIGFFYPVYASLKAIESEEKDDDTRWLIYWVIYAMFTIVETFTDTILYWIPFYFAFKVGFLVWLMLPSHNGAELIYKKVLKPFVAKNAVFGQSSPESVGKMD